MAGLGGTVGVCPRKVLGHKKDNMPRKTKAPKYVATRYDEDKSLSWSRPLAIFIDDGICVPADLAWDTRFGFTLTLSEIRITADQVEFRELTGPLGDERDDLIAFVRTLTQEDLRQLATGTRGGMDYVLPSAPHPSATMPAWGFTRVPGQTSSGAPPATSDGLATPIVAGSADNGVAPTSDA